ncbi:MAG: U-box domain-containing protein [Candidatus Protochlamydia sp.]|nr:U-box domain-containing protein [Candidatus Protochlamydia sp.]
MNEIANRQNIEVAEWRESGPKQGMVWRIGTLVQAVAWTVFTVFLGPIFSQSIFNLWREAWTGRVVELYEGPGQLSIPLVNSSFIELVSQPTGQIPSSELQQQSLPSKEKAQKAIKAFFNLPSPDLNANDLLNCTLATQLDLSEAPYISLSKLEAIINAINLSEILFPFPLAWNDWNKSTRPFLNPFETLRYILTVESLPLELKINFNSSLENDMPQKSLLLANLFASLSPKESLRLFECLRAFSEEQAQLIYVLLLMSGHQSTECSLRLKAILIEHPRTCLSLFVNQPQNSFILESYLNDISCESFSELIEGLEAAPLKYLFNRLSPQPEKQKLVLNQLVNLYSEKEVIIYELYNNSADRNAFLRFILSNPELSKLLIKKMQRELSPGLMIALEFFLTSYSPEARLESFKALLRNEVDIIFENIFNVDKADLSDHSILLVNLCLLKITAILETGQPDEEKKQIIKDIVKRLPYASDSIICAQELAKLVDPLQSEWIMQNITEPIFLTEFKKTAYEKNLQKFISTHALSKFVDLANPLFPLDKINLIKIFQACPHLNELKWNCHNELSPLISLENLPVSLKLKLTPETPEAFESLVLQLSNKERKKLLSIVEFFSPSHIILFQIISENDDLTQNNPLICPITQEIMKDPVVDTEGNSYERIAIEQWLEKNLISPLTRQPLSREQLRPNRQLKQTIEFFTNNNG